MNTARLRDPILIQAVIAAALSFAHIHDIAEAAGQTGWKAWAYPVSVDLLMVMAWTQIRAKDGAPKKAPWFWFLLSLAASLGANIATAGVLDLAALPTWLKVVVAGWPAVAFLGGSLLVHNRKAHTEEISVPALQAPAEEPGDSADEEKDPEPEIAPQAPTLVSYAEAAQVAGVDTATIRGRANGPRASLTKYTGPVPGSVCVDLDEVRKLYGLGV